MKVNVQYLVWYVAGLVSICVFFLFSGNLKTYRTYHGDETYWIRSGQWTFQKMFVEKIIPQSYGRRNTAVILVHSVHELQMQQS